MTEEEEKKKEKQVPVRPMPDFTLADKFAAISKNCEMGSYYCKFFPWIFVPLGIGLCASGNIILGTIFLVLAVFSFIGAQVCAEYKDNFEQAMLNEEKEAVKNNEPKLQQYYEKCAEMGIEPNKAPTNDKSKDKPKKEPKPTINMSSKQVAETLAKQAVKPAQQPTMETELLK